MVGETLTADTTGSTDADGEKVTFTYQWYRAEDNQGKDEAKIDNATSKTYTLVAEDAGKHIDVKVIPNDGTVDGKEVAAEYTEKIKAKNTPPAAKVTIKGNPVVGETLTADTTGSTDADGDKVTLKYQWYRAEDNQGKGEAKIDKAVSKTYTLAVAHEGKYITVKVTPNDGKVDGKEATAVYTMQIGTLLVDIPDSKFRRYLQAKIPEAFVRDKMNRNTKAVKNLKVINVENMEIHSLQGIEYFTALTELKCLNNQLTELDLTHNTALNMLSCIYNQLTELDLPHNTNLTRLYCSENQLTELDLTHNTALTDLRCFSNSFTSLDITHNTALTVLVCEDNLLTSLDLTRNTALTNLRCSSNSFTSLDITHNTALTVLVCEDNLLTSLDLTRNTALTNLSCFNNQITRLDLSNNRNLNSSNVHADTVVKIKWFE